MDLPLHIPTPDEQPTVTVEFAAKALGISRTLAYEAAGSGQLPTIAIGRRLLVPTAALRKLLHLDAA